jgi:hypothetical protein
MQTDGKFLTRSAALRLSNRQLPLRHRGSIAFAKFAKGGSNSRILKVFLSIGENSPLLAEF